MHIKEGMIPTILGTVVTATGIVLRNTNLPESYSDGIIGFGLAHIAIGSTEMISQNIQNRDVMGRVTRAIQFK